MVATYGSKEAVWLQILFSRIKFEKRATKVSCDSQSIKFFIKNPFYHSKTKHIDVQYHLVRVMVESRHIGKHNRLVDQVCECCEVLLVQRDNGHCCPRFVNESSGISCFSKEDNKWENVGLLYSLQ